jgi:hypothetical protein
MTELIAFVAEQQVLITGAAADHAVTVRLTLRPLACWRFFRAGWVTPVTDELVRAVFPVRFRRRSLAFRSRARSMA